MSSVSPVPGRFAGPPRGRISWGWAILLGQEMPLILIVEFVRQTGVDHVVLCVGFETLFSPFAELGFEQDGVPRIALVQRVHEVAQERHQPNDKVNGNIQSHPDLGPLLQRRLDGTGGAEDHASKEGIGNVAKSEKTGVSVRNVVARAKGADPGMRPITDDQPNRAPKKLNKHRSSR